MVEAVGDAVDGGVYCGGGTVKTIAGLLIKEEMRGVEERGGK